MMIRSSTTRWAVHVARLGQKRNSHRNLVGKPEGKRPLGKHRRLREDNIEMDLKKEIRCLGME